MKKFVLLILLLFCSKSWAVEFRECPSSGSAMSSSPLVVDTKGLIEKVKLLQDEKGNKIFADAPVTFEESIKQTFDISLIKTKMAQFYSMLWILSEELNRQKIQNVSFARTGVQSVLLASKVFTDPTIPSRIQTIRFDLSKKNAPQTFVTFDKKGVEIPLNQGDGFYLYRNGKCQHAQKLIFEQEFSFLMKRNLGNLMVSDFKGVDLFGDFGNRGFVDVDIQYVTLRSVEFISGTVDGRVTAYVSREEFAKNQHNALLEMVTRFVPDRSVQPIDW